MSDDLERELREIEHDAYKVNRTAGDARAVETGGAPKLLRRIARRKIVS
jgi:hypothetical protein